ncbi:MAG: response regulator [Candidatus Kapabacteria bacterium]|nr:response regulator [Candidatus Kapabacteria bacterium]
MSTIPKKDNKTDVLPFVLMDTKDQLLNALEIVVRNVVPNASISKAYSGNEGIRLIKRLGSKAIVMCDYEIPDFKGIGLLDRLRLENETSKNYVVLLLEKGQREEAMKALKHGVDDILYKPFSKEELITCVKSASRIVNLENHTFEKNAEVEVLKEIFLNQINEISLGYNDLLNDLMPRKIERLDFVEHATLWIADKLNCFSSDELSTLRKACRLLYIGHIGLPQNLINSAITKNGFLASEKMAPVATFPEKLFKSIPTMQKVANVLTYIYENIDGSGFPKNIQSIEIPRSSRILRVIKDYEYFTIDLNQNQTKAIDSLMEFSKRLYDCDIIAYLDQYFATNDSTSKLRERKIEFGDLRDGMMFSRNIITVSGLLLVPKMTTLTIDLILKIRDITKADAVIGDFYVFVPKDEDLPIFPKETKQNTTEVPVPVEEVKTQTS